MKRRNVFKILLGATLFPKLPERKTFGFWAEERMGAFYVGENVDLSKVELGRLAKLACVKLE